MMRPVILYGPPAVGKDTITGAITRKHSLYRQFRILKTGGGKTSTYRMTTMEWLAEAELVTLWRRYDNSYAIDADGLDGAIKTFRPIIHLGAIEQVRSVLAYDQIIDWVVVDLHYPRAVAQERLKQRNPLDIKQRLDIFDRTPLLPTSLAELRLDTSECTPDQAADSILSRALARG